MALPVAQAAAPEAGKQAAAGQEEEAVRRRRPEPERRRRQWARPGADRNPRELIGPGTLKKGRIICLWEST